MKKLVFLLSGFISFTSTAQNFKLVSSSPANNVIEFTFNPVDFAHTIIQGQQYIDFSKTYKVVSQEKGSPTVPYFSESIIIPNKGNATILVNESTFTDYHNIQVSPSKGDLKRNIDPALVPFEFGSTYNENAFYPSQIAEIGNPYILRNTRGLTVKFNPVQYNPVTKTLRVYHSVRVLVSNNPSKQGINELHSSNKVLDGYTNIYLNHYLNASEILKRYTPMAEQGEMFIIAAPQFTEAMQPFVDWKNKKGIKTTMVSTSVAGTTSTAIKNYVAQQYTQNSDLLYLLLVGDHEQLPAHTYGMSGYEELWSDSYYAQLAGGANDYYPELFVGRFSAANLSELTPQIEKVLEYEKTPLAGTWMKNALGLASNEGDGYGDDSESDFGHLRAIRTQLMNFGYTTVHEFYQGSQGGADAPGEPTINAISQAINDGIGIFNYTGHGWHEGVSTGDYKISDVQALQNNGKYPFVVSVACNNGSFVGQKCFGEAWMQATTANGNTGAIAVVGSSILMSWAPPMQAQDEMTSLITESYQNNRKTTIGGLFYNSQMSVLENYNSNWTANEVMQTWILFGDPSTVFRTKETVALTATHVPTINQSVTSVTVNCNTEGAQIAISQDGILLGTGIVSGGVATITFSPLTSLVNLDVVATKQNYNIYEGQITIQGGNLSIFDLSSHNIAVYPNPTNCVVTVMWQEQTSSATITVKDIQGKLISTQDLSASTQETTVDLSVYDAGIYFITVKNNTVESTTKIIKK